MLGLQLHLHSSDYRLLPSRPRSGRRPSIRCTPFGATEFKNPSTGLTFNYKINMDFLINNNNNKKGCVVPKNGSFPSFHSHSRGPRPSFRCRAQGNLLLSPEHGLHPASARGGCAAEAGHCFLPRLLSLRTGKNHFFSFSQVSRSKTQHPKMGPFKNGNTNFVTAGLRYVKAAASQGEAPARPLGHGDSASLPLRQRPLGASKVALSRVRVG